MIIFLNKSGEGYRGGKKGKGRTFNSVVFSMVKLKIKENSKTVQKNILQVNQAGDNTLQKHESTTHR